MNFFRFFSIFISVYAFSLSTSVAQGPPKLLIGIVIDQMRYDYLHKYYGNFGEGGFKRLLANGFSIPKMRSTITYLLIQHLVMQAYIPAQILVSMAL